MIAQKRISLDKLAPVRLILAWLIVFYHTYRYLGVPHPMLAWIAWMGPLATDLFFVISGVSISLLYTRKISEGELSLPKYLVMRLSKLYPLLLLILPHFIFCWYLLVVGDVYDHNHQLVGFWQKTFACIYPYLMLDAWKLGYTPGIAPTWVISAFLFCYFAFYFWVKYVHRYLRRFPWLMVVLLSGIALALSSVGLSQSSSYYWGQILHTFPPVRFVLFLLGAYWVWAIQSVPEEAWKHKNFRWWLRVALACLSCLALGWLMTFVWPKLVLPTTVWRLFFAPFTTALLLLWATSSWGVDLPRTIQLFRSWTNFSLPLFMLHIPISVWYFRMWQTVRLTTTMDFVGVNDLLSTMKKVGYFERFEAWKYLLFLFVCWMISSLAYRWVIAPVSDVIRRRWA